MIASVAAAFLACGRRNACTPSATASTPVSADAPEENARRSRNSVTAATGSTGKIGGGRDVALREALPQARHDRDAHDRRRSRTSGARRARPPPSRRGGSPPSRARRSPDAISTLWSARDGAAEVIAIVPAVIETATVST